MKISKLLGIYLGTIYLATAVFPLVAIGIKAPRVEAGRPQAVSAPAFVETAAALNGTEPKESSDGFRLYDTASSKISTVSDRDFLLGSLACEMSPEAPIEALKAQAIASYSYYSRIKVESADKKYDLAWNSKSPSTWCSKKILEKKWGESAKDKLKLLEKAIDAVSGMSLTYNGELACSSFFAISNGKTETAQEMWGKDYPYLTSVASPYDTLSKDFERNYSYSPKRIKEIAQDAWPKARFNFELPYSQWFKDIVYTVGGSVISVNICGFSVSGSEAGSVFSLGSPTFAVEYKDEKFRFRAKGRGHGVGMSQTGAMYMASEGAGYEEILNWYFPGTTIEKAS